MMKEKETGILFFERNKQQAANPVFGIVARKTEQRHRPVSLFFSLF